MVDWGVGDHSEKVDIIDLAVVMLGRWKIERTEKGTDKPVL